MLNELTQADILQAIRSLLKNGYTKTTPYGVWYHGNLIPPKDVIREAYLIKGGSNPNLGYHVDRANERLLELGFPIVESDKSDESHFFTEKDLASFSHLANRSSYDRENAIDQNIKDYLYKIPWGKTETWAKKLKSKNWIVKGRRNWNIQDRTHGQSYKKYTWFRVFPREFINELIFFTVGVSLGGDLVYKIDIYRDHKDFPKNLMPYFDNRRDEIKGVQKIKARELASSSWDDLILKTDHFFRMQLENYFSISKELWSDERLMRLTWNTNNWESPTRHKWNPKYQGTNEAHERQYGFGHEEWLFNSRYRVKGFQYGYIEGVNLMSGDQRTIDQLLLFTIDSKSKDRYLIGRLKDVEIIERYEPDLKLIRPVVVRHFGKMLEELKSTRADVTRLRKTGFDVNVKFEWAKAEIFNVPVLFNQIKGRKYNRFQPYKIEESLRTVINDKLNSKAKLLFQPGKASNSPTYEKNTNANKTTVQRTHGAITDDLYNYLINYRGFVTNQLSCERTRVGGQIVDFAIKEDDVFTLFEVKTESAGLRNIRTAIGQLFEYALLDQSIKIKKLIIVGPANLVGQEIEYFNTLQSLISLPMEYWGYTFEKTGLENKFCIVK